MKLVNLLRNSTSQIMDMIMMTKNSANMKSTMDKPNHDPACIEYLHKLLDNVRGQTVFAEASKEGK
jgi:hypothetical protein